MYMKLTPDQRRKRIQKMIEEHPELLRMQEAYTPAKTWFDKFTALLPRPLRNRIREYPGMMFFIHSRTLDIICKQMKFPDED